MSLRKIRLLTAGESHGPGQTAILEGLPAGITLSLEELQRQMARRRAGYGRGPRMKMEMDEVEITGGLRHGKTLGSPIGILIRNLDYSNWQSTMHPWNVPETAQRVVHRPRPGHADLAGGMKYGEKDLRNVLERASARETVARTAAGSVCRQLLSLLGIEIGSHVVRIGKVKVPDESISWERIHEIQESELFRCVDKETEQAMTSAVDEAYRQMETLGGIAEIVAHNVPAGLGSYVHWDLRLDGRIAQAMMGIPAIKGVLFGQALTQVENPGSMAHDEVFHEPERGFYRQTNRAGGVEGGVTNGEEIRVRILMKPLSTLRKPLKSVDVTSKAPETAIVERSDTCSVPAAGVIGEAMLALVLTDAVLEKFSSDTLPELQSSIENYRERLREY